MKKSLTALCLLIFTLSGGQFASAKTVKAKPEAIAAIKTVRIADEVPLPDTMFYQGKDETWALATGQPWLMNKGGKEQIIATMQHEKIDLPSIVKAEFAKALQNAGPMTVVEAQDNADGKIDLKVEMYGLGQTQGFSPLLYPVLRIEAKLTRVDGTVVWQKSDYITPQNKENTGGHKFEEYMQQPELLRATWTNIAGIVSRAVLKTLYPPAKKK